AADEVASDNCRSVQPDEQFRIEALFKSRHRMVDQPAAPPHVEAHIVAFGRHPVDVARSDPDQPGEIRSPEFIEPLRRFRRYLRRRFAPRADTVAGPLERSLQAGW